MAGATVEQLPLGAQQTTSSDGPADADLHKERRITEGGRSAGDSGKPELLVETTAELLSVDDTAEVAEGGLSAPRELSAISERSAPPDSPTTQVGRDSPAVSLETSPRDSGNHSLTGEEPLEAGDDTGADHAGDVNDIGASQKHAQSEVKPDEEVELRQAEAVADPDQEETGDHGYQEAGGEDATMSGSVELMLPADPVGDIPAAHVGDQEIAVDHVVVQRYDGEHQPAEAAASTIDASDTREAHSDKSEAEKEQESKHPDKSPLKHQNTMPVLKPPRTERTKRRSRAVSEPPRAAKRTTRSETTHESRVGSRATPRERSRAESRSTRKQEIPRAQKPPASTLRRRASSQEELRSQEQANQNDAEAGHAQRHASGEAPPARPAPPRGARLQKSSSLAVIPRSNSATLEDLHVYLVPSDKWSSPRQLADKGEKSDTISLGFVRVHPDSTLSLLRREISGQLLGNELALRHYKFVRPVGKHFAQVKTKQESHLKARNFMPPYTSDPEIHLLRLLPHDTLQQSEEAAYWRAWDRAVRLDRDYPVVRHTFLNLRKKLTEAKQRRAENEHRRDELVLLSRSLQEQLSIKRDEDMQRWRELYLQERKVTGPLEEACATLRRDIEKMHQKLLQRVETRHKGTGKEGPSRKLTMKLNCKHLQSEIEDWRRRVKATQLMLDTETKLRKQAEQDVKSLRQELSQKRVTVTQARSQYGLDSVDWYLLLGRQRQQQQQQQQQLQQLPSTSRTPSRQQPAPPADRVQQQQLQQP